MAFFKKLRKKVRNQALTMAEPPRRLPPIPDLGKMINPFIDSPRIETGALSPAGMSMPVAPSEAGLRPRDRFKIDRGRKRLPRFLRDRMPSGRPTPRFFGGGLGSFFGRIFDQLEREDKLRRLPFREDMPMERFPMMRPGFAAGDEVDMDMMMADQAAREGISPAEQRMMMIIKTAADLGRTISDRDAQLFGMGEISFEEAMSRARPSIDRVSGERNLMQQEQMFFPEKKSFRDSQQAFKGTRLGDALSYVPDLMQVADYMGLKNFAEGGAVESEIDEALEDIQSVQPEAMVIQQVMTMVMEMIQSGASEEQIVAALKEMGLDDEDIQQVMMMIAEEMAGQESIDGQLAQMM